MEIEKAYKVTLRKQKTREMGRKIPSFDNMNNTLNILYQQTTGLFSDDKKMQDFWHLSTDSE